MAQINMTPELAAALVNRLSTEYGQTSTSNFALDILLDGANAQIIQLTERCNLLEERCKKAEADNEALKQQLDPKRMERMDRLRTTADRSARRTSRLNGDAAKA